MKMPANVMTSESTQGIQSDLLDCMGDAVDEYFDEDVVDFECDMELEEEEE